MRRLVLSTLLLVLGTAAPGAAQLPIFDAHVHYSRPDWTVYSPERALFMLTSAGVRRAIVSSTPDDGTMMLYEKAPKTVVPFLRPYRTRDDMGQWHSDPGVETYVEERLKRGIYRGIGEFHLSAPDAGAPTVRRIAELAADRNLFLQAHVDDVTIEKLLTLYPEAAIPVGARRHVGARRPPSVACSSGFRCSTSSSRYGPTSPRAARSTRSGARSS